MGSDGRTEWLSSTAHEILDRFREEGESYSLAVVRLHERLKAAEE